jgi:hypothetical protein
MIAFSSFGFSLIQFWFISIQFLTISFSKPLFNSDLENKFLFQKMNLITIHPRSFKFTQHELEQAWIVGRISGSISADFRKKKNCSEKQYFLRVLKAVFNRFFNVFLTFSFLRSCVQQKCRIRLEDVLDQLLDGVSHVGLVLRWSLEPSQKSVFLKKIIFKCISIITYYEDRSKVPTLLVITFQ